MIVKTILNKVETKCELDLEKDSLPKCFTKGVVKGFVETSIDGLCAYGVIFLGIMVYAGIKGKTKE